MLTQGCFDRGFRWQISLGDPSPNSSSTGESLSQGHHIVCHWKFAWMLIGFSSSKHRAWIYNHWNLSLAPIIKVFIVGGCWWNQCKEPKKNLKKTVRYRFSTSPQIKAMFWKVSLPKAHFNVRSVEVFIVCPKTFWKPPRFFCMPPKNSTPKHHPIGPKDRSDNWSCRANPQRSVTARLVNQGNISRMYSLIFHTCVSALEGSSNVYHHHVFCFPGSTTPRYHCLKHKTQSNSFGFLAAFELEFSSKKMGSNWIKSFCQRCKDETFHVALTFFPCP